MTIAEHLDELRRDEPTCDVVAFADLSTGLVLATSSARKVSQERFDQLCACAADALRGPMHDTIVLTVMNRKEDCVDYAIAMSPGATEVFVEAPLETDEALCMVCNANTDIEALVQRARKTLARIESGE